MSATSPPPPAAPLPPPPKPRRKSSPFRRASGLLTLLAVLIAVAPSVIARTGLRHHLCAFARPGLPEGITIQSATIGWFSPVVFRDVRVPDLQGGALLSVAEIRTDRPLWELATHPGDIGRLTVDRPRLEIALHSAGSNLQDVLDRLKSTPGPRSRPRLRFECHGGELQIADEQSRVQLGCTSIEALYDDLRQEAQPATARLSVATTAPTPNGRLEFSAEWTPSANDRELIGPGAVEVQLVEWPLDPLLPLLRESLGATACAGQATLTVQSTWESLSTAGGRAQLDVALAALDAALQPADSSAAPVTISTRDAGLRLAGSYDGTVDTLTLGESRFHSEWLDGTLSGTLSDLRGQCLCDIGGDLQVKLQSALQWLPTDVQQNVQINGLETQRIAVRGPLRCTNPADTFAVQADIVWKLLEAYNVTSADAEVRVRYAGGRVETEPTRVPLSDGRVASVPVVTLTPVGPVLAFSGQTILERVAFNEAMCRGWMRYLSPLMANSTRVEGRFSLTVDPREVPLHAWPNSELSGRLSIHAARVGPGPLTQQILGLVQQVRGLTGRPGAEPAADRLGEWLTIAEQDVQFAVQNGRVAHRDLKLYVGQVAVESQGSVGLADESLDLQVRIRFPDSWFADRPVLAQLRGDGLLIPIRGTLSQPQVEPGVLREFGRGLGLRAVDGFLRRALER